MISRRFAKGLFVCLLVCKRLTRPVSFCCVRLAQTISVNHSSLLAPRHLSPASPSILARFFSALYRTSASGPLRSA